jgi:hypothetical protein
MVPILTIPAGGDAVEEGDCMLTLHQTLSGGSHFVAVAYNKGSSPLRAEEIERLRCSRPGAQHNGSMRQAWATISNFSVKRPRISIAQNPPRIMIDIKELSEKARPSGCAEFSCLRVIFSFA